MRTVNNILILLVSFVPLIVRAAQPEEAPIWVPLGAPFRLCNPDTVLNGDTSKTNPVYDAIVPEVYHEGHRFEVQQTTLSVVPEPRWFNRSQLPKSLQEIPLSDQGASLNFRIHTATNGCLRFVLTLDARERTIWREIEHRWTNIVPFLFTFSSDGEPIGPKAPASWGRDGGVNGMTEAVPKGTSVCWNVTVDARSIASALGVSGPKTLTVAAAFSECQHECTMGLGKHDAGVKIKGAFKGPPVIIRSNEVTLGFDGTKWEVKEHR